MSAQQADENLSAAAQTKCESGKAISNRLTLFRSLAHQPLIKNIFLHGTHPKSFFSSPLIEKTGLCTSLLPVEGHIEPFFQNLMSVSILKNTQFDPRALIPRDF